MQRIETVIVKNTIKGFKERIRLTQGFEKKGCKVLNCCEHGYIQITQEVTEY